MNFPKVGPSPEEIRYANYVAYCEKQGIKPARLESWLKTVGQIPERNYSFNAP